MNDERGKNNTTCSGNSSARKKECVKGESNPQLNLGRVPCYHYTINALGVAWPKKSRDTYAILRCHKVARAIAQVIGLISSQLSVKIFTSFIEILFSAVDFRDGYLTEMRHQYIQ
jgi:hypothetical protein